jgi:MFS transporter, DHA2 family, multidrug resistance protein
MARDLPAGVPAGAAEVARDTLGGALTVAERLPAELGTALVESARAAFTGGLRVVFAVAAALTVGIAVLVATLLRRAAGGDDPGPAA